MQVTEREYRWHAANDKQYESPKRRGRKKGRHKQRSEEELEQMREASRQGQARFQAKAYQKAKSDLAFILKRIEARSYRSGGRLDIDLRAVEGLRAQIADYENADRI